ncbi:hypothetical protein J2S74_003160 [Evansella vedderi]|uniref:Uncharacterized protein n=1 Tax=Evansella vedderi TaxID=38282 RepID=A0ABT9ZX27_9BACI|nr:hypothetical protein [Evansella vedderi]MDQ0255778.1 hypothetical protein [Evansella vedderi]
MAESKIYFKDNFFSAGITEIFNGNKQRIGSLDLKSAFTSSVDVLDKEQKVVSKGYFPFFSGKWVITDGLEMELGLLRQRFSFFTKKYEYEAKGCGIFTIESEAFSREYEIFNEEGDKVALFKKINGFFESPVYQLANESQDLSNEEVIAMVMGVNMINKRNRKRNSSAGGGNH